MHECEADEKQYCPDCGEKLFEESSEWEDITEYVTFFPRSLMGKLLVDAKYIDDTIGYFSKNGFKYMLGKDEYYKVVDTLDDWCHEDWMKVYRRV